MSPARLAAAAAFAAVMLASGVLHGRHTGRWTPLPPLDGYAARLDAIPLVLGDWAGEDRPMDPDELRRGGIHGFRHRAYRNRKTGEEATLFVVCGRPGPIAVHTPDVCYRGAGFEPVGDPARVPVAAGSDPRSLWTLRFHKPGGLPGRDLEIFWGWTAGGPLDAAAAPRLTYAAAPALYKVYLIRYRRPGATDAAADDPFLRAAVRAVEAAVAAPPGEPDPS